MPAPLSVDLREQILTAYQAKAGSQRQLAERFKVSLSFIRDLLRHYREMGSVQPKPHGGGAVAKVGNAQLPIVEALVQKQPNALLSELCDRFAAQTGVEVSVSTMQRVVSQLKFSVKKNADCLPTSYATGQSFALCFPILEFHSRPTQFSVH
ncbi:helix-turn-helix domain-containing protein [Leptodesmis sp.]|uniref:helix-turn-helix domain-containing protein n=1 Tax=Leptodesmis sp. TaxID=3100501 RepID=UPI00405346AD